MGGHGRVGLVLGVSGDGGPAGWAALCWVRARQDSAGLEIDLFLAPLRDQIILALWDSGGLARFRSL
jgi:hypothetical protein